MEPAAAAPALAALGHLPRLEVFRLLVKAGPEGMMAGDIARATGTLPNTLSTHLQILSAAGLIGGRRDGRSIVYTAAYDRVGELLSFLVEDCCGDQSDLCNLPFRAEAGRG